MFEIRIRCSSLAPLLMNRLDDQALREVATHDDPTRTPEAMFDSQVYRAPDGRIALPRKMFLSMLKEAGREVKVGRHKVTTKDATLLPSLLSIVEDYIYLDGGQPGSEPIVTRDSRKGVRRTGRKTENVRVVRPKLQTWGFKLTLQVGTRSQAATARQLFEVAGRDVCLGNFRPSGNLRKKLKANDWPPPFGRFQITGWEVKEVDQPVGIGEHRPTAEFFTERFTVVDANT